MKKIAMLTLMAALAASPACAQAPAAETHNQHHGSAASSADFSNAEVRRVDKDAQKLTLRHGPIASLGMGDMTMVFRVADPRMLDGLKQGDKIRFKADKVGGQYTVTELELAN